MRYDLIVWGCIYAGGRGMPAHTACCAAGWQAE